MRSTSPLNASLVNVPRSASSPLTHPPADPRLSDVIDHGLLRCAYQPIVELGSGRVTGFEALARGPEGTALARPDQLFGVARNEGRLRELDAACRQAAVAGADAAGLSPPWSLFVNCEPESLDDAGFALPRTTYPVILELTERDLTRRPVQLLRTVRRVRRAGWGVALDDVGADPASLALLPLLRPDVIKLDLSLVQRRPSAHVAAVVNAVLAESERSGAHVLAEGIETAEHLQTARSFGATLGQGWYFARPGALQVPGAAHPAADLSRVRNPELPDERASPFALAAAVRAPRVARKSLLIEISKHLERQAMSCGETTVCLSTFQQARHFTTATRRRYQSLARTACFVGAIGEGMAVRPMPGVRGAHLREADPVRGEWDIAVVGPHFAACLVGRDLGDTGPEETRRFEYVMSHDRELAVSVAASLMSRMAERVPLAIAPPRMARDEDDAMRSA